MDGRMDTGMAGQADTDRDMCSWTYGQFYAWTPWLVTLTDRQRDHMSTLIAGPVGQTTACPARHTDIIHVAGQTLVQPDPFLLHPCT